MIKDYSLKALELAINQVLQLDPAMATKLAAIEGKSIELVIEPLAVNFFMQFISGEVRLSAKLDKTADTTIHASPLGLIRLSLLPASQARSLFNDKIRIKGDVELGQKVKEIFDGLDIDWEGHLAQFTGDVVAHQMGSAVASTKAFAAQVQDTMTQNLSEYLQHEARTVPSREECNDFFKDIDAIRLDFDRLEAKFQRVIKKYESN